MQLVGGLVGWVWIFASFAAFILFIGALFFDAKWSSFFWAFGIGAVAKLLMRRFAETQKQATFEASSARLRDEAELLVNAYGAALERAGSVVASEALLPAPKNSIKGALLYAANEARASGQLKMVEHLRTGYASLANFVPPAEAEKLASFETIVAAGVGASGEDPVAAAERLAAQPSMTETMERATAGFARLGKEFDELLGKRSAPAARP